MSNTGALVYTRAATADKNANSGVFTRHCAPASPLPSPDAWPYGPRNEVRRTVTVASMTTSVEMVMRGLTRFARYLVPSALVVCVMSLGAPCAAQEVDATYWTGRCQRWTLARYLRALGLAGAESPLCKRQIALKLYGFYHSRYDLDEVSHQSHKLTSRFGRQSF